MTLALRHTKDLSVTARPRSPDSVPCSVSVALLLDSVPLLLRFLFSGGHVVTLASHRLLWRSTAWQRPLGRAACTDTAARAGLAGPLVTLRFVAGDPFSPLWSTFYSFLTISSDCLFFFFGGTLSITHSRMGRVAGTRLSSQEPGLLPAAGR